MSSAELIVFLQPKSSAQYPLRVERQQGLHRDGDGLGVLQLHRHCRYRSLVVGRVAPLSRPVRAQSDYLLCRFVGFHLLSLASTDADERRRSNQHPELTLPAV